MFDQVLPLTIAIAAIMTLGYLAQYFGICMVRATQNTLNGDPTLLFAVLFSGAWVWFYVIAAQYYHWETPFKRYEFHFMFIIGGLFFGFGSGVNQACSVSTMNQLAKGNLGKIATMMGWFIGWALWQFSRRIWFSEITYTAQAPLSINSILTIGLGVSVFFVTFFILFRPSKTLFIGVSYIGLLASLLYYIEPQWPPSSYMRDLGNAEFFGGVAPSLSRLMIIMGLMAGMWLAVAINHNINIRIPKFGQLMRYLFGGTLMGIGASMALGGNDSQILLGIPSISTAALAMLAAMFFGITIEAWVYRYLRSHGLNFYRKT